MLVGLDASRLTRARRTGTENYSLEVVRSLLRQDQRNRYRLYLSADLPGGLLPQRRDTEHRVIRLPRLWTHLGLGPEVARRPPDVLFVPSHVLPLTRLPPSVVVIYDVGHRFFPRAHRLAEWLYVEWAIRRHVRLASHLVTISESAKADIVRLYGAESDRISVASPAVEPRFAPLPPERAEAVRTRYGLPTRFLLCVGTVKARKNLPRLVGAFARARVPEDVHLVLAGGVETRSAERDLWQAIDRSRVSGRVRLLSYVAGDDLPALYNAALAATLVSVHEGFGMPALEAMASGTPVVVSDRGALPEVVGAAGVRVNPLDELSIAAGIERAVADGELRAELRRRGLRQATRYTWDEAGRVTLAALEKAARA